MAMVKLSAGITEIEGKSGGDVWRKDQCGQHVQAAPRHVDKYASYRQKKRRRAYLKCMNYIREHATVEFAARWQIYANQHPRKNKKGESYTLAWWQQFMSINIKRVYNDLEILQYPPE